MSIQDQQDVSPSQDVLYRRELMQKLKTSRSGNKELLHSQLKPADFSLVNLHSGHGCKRHPRQLLKKIGKLKILRPPAFGSNKLEIENLRFRSIFDHLLCYLHLID